MLTAKCAHGKRDGMKSVRECQYQMRLDLETLVWTRGRDMPLSWLKERLRCPRCGSRCVTVIFAPPTGPATMKPKEPQPVGHELWRIEVAKRRAGKA